MRGQTGAKQRTGERAGGVVGAHVSEAQHKGWGGRQPRDANALAQPTGAMLWQSHASLEHCLCDFSPTFDEHIS